MHCAVAVGPGSAHMDIMSRFELAAVPPQALDGATNGSCTVGLRLYDGRDGNNCSSLAIEMSVGLGSGGRLVASE